MDLGAGPTSLATPRDVARQLGICLIPPPPTPGLTEGRPAPSTREAVVFSMRAYAARGRASTVRLSGSTVGALVLNQPAF